MYKIKIWIVMDLEAPVPSVVEASLAQLNASSGRAHNWCWTWNNYDRLPALLDFSGARYLCYGEETAPSTGTKHLQGFVAFAKQVRFSTVRKMLPLAHFIVARGSPQQNKAYCSKEGEFHEYGDLPVCSGHRSDLDDVVQAIHDGKELVDLAREYPKQYILHHSGFQALYAIARSAEQRDRDMQPAVVVHFGCSGSGKSTSARSSLRSIYGEDFYEYTPDQKGYFQRYLGQKGVLFDEIGGLTLNFLKVLLHPGRVVVPVKYGDASWLAKDIHICSNHSPDDWFWRHVRDDPDAVLPLWRVFSKVVLYVDPYDASGVHCEEHVREASDMDGRRLRRAVMARYSDVRVAHGLSAYENHTNKDL